MTRKIGSENKTSFNKQPGLALPRGTEKCPLSALTGVRIKRVNFRSYPLYRGVRIKRVFHLAEIKILCLSPYY